MTPPISIPTDNIYKFGCLFGLALIITATVSYSNVYYRSLDYQEKYRQIIFDLEESIARTPTQNTRLSDVRDLLEITKQNEKFIQGFNACLGLAGLLLSVISAHLWLTKNQRREDLFADLQIAKLRQELSKPPPTDEEQASRG